MSTQPQAVQGVYDVESGTSFSNFTVTVETYKGFMEQTKDSDLKEFRKNSREIFIEKDHDEDDSSQFEERQMNQEHYASQNSQLAPQNSITQNPQPSSSSQTTQSAQLVQENPTIQNPQPAPAERRTYKNPTKNLWKNFLKAYMSMILSKDLDHIKQLIRFFEGKDGDYCKRYVERIEEIQVKVKDADSVSFEDMRNLLLDGEFGTTTRILFDRFRRKNLDRRIFYSRIERTREHFLFKRVIKKILKDPGGVNSFK